MWLVRNVLVQGRATTSTLAIYPLGMAEINQFLDTLSFWLLPFGVRLLGLDTVLPGIERVLVLGLLGSVLGGVFLLGRHTPLGLRARMQQQPVLAVLLLFGLLYLVFVVVARLGFYRNIPFDTRLLLPLFPVIVIWGSVLVHSVGTSLPPLGWLGGVRWLIVLVWVLVLLGSGLRGARWLSECAAARGCYRGYAGPAWQTSATIAAIRALDAHRPVYTNEVYAVRFLSTAPVYPLPEKVLAFTGQPNPHYAAELADLERALREQGAVLAYFDGLPAVHIPMLAELQAAGLSLRLWQATADGALYVGE